MKSTGFILTASIVWLALAKCSNPNQTAGFKHPLPATADTNVVIPPAWAFGII